MTKPRIITEPGIYNLNEETYHGDPVEGGSLSPSSAKYLIPGDPFDGCPRKFAYKRDTPQKPKTAFDTGHVVHKLVLGEGNQIVVVDAKDWRTKAAQEAKAEAYKKGHIPCLRETHDAAQAMAKALYAHPFAGDLFKYGKAERSLFWKDPEYGVWLRTRPDWMPTKSDIFPDYKTAASAAIGPFQRQAYNIGYCIQAAFRIEGIKALGIHPDPKFVFVVQEKEPPHMVTVFQPTPNEIQWGRIFMRKAISEFAKCQTEDDWTREYATDIVQGIFPSWAEPKLEKLHEMGAYQAAEFNKPLPE